MWQLIKDIFMDPLIALSIFVIFLVGYLVYIGFEGGFSEKFLHFGPGTTPENTTNFLAIKLDTWPKVSVMYTISFISSFITGYYYMAVNTNLHSYVWNRAIKTIPYSRFTTLLVLMTEPILQEILGVILFFTTLTMQLQFLLPGMLGGFLSYIPGVFARLEGKKFNPNSKK
jgi:hypothetical protein